ncbi:MAG: FecR family protein [Tannerella sp.]|jgi:ferric-dicitrate binding protein FerR (iron transport regulator)|nr:FecR family protein [Tannerella sp.]
MDKNILQRYIEGQLSQKEKENVARWLDADEKNMKEFLIRRRIYDATLWSESLSERAANKAAEKKPPIKRAVYEILKIAAIFLIVWAGIRFLSPTKPSTQELQTLMQTVHVPEGQRAEITLSDRTNVWLNANTRLTFPSQFSDTERNVELDGEGYFKVARDESKKFTVKTEQYEVNVLGTEFNVKAYRKNHQFETALIEGSVEIKSSDDNEKMTLSPLQYAYSKEGGLVRDYYVNYGQFSWKEGIIAFENESMRDIFERLELYYDIRIEVKNKTIPDAPYSGKFSTKDSIEHIMKVLQRYHSFKYVRDKETNRIIIY